MGSSNETSAFGPVLNPHDRTRVPGGSSGGSAAAVAADLVPVALGSDTGGSIRQPAAFCGIVGLKPTYGLVSRYGLVAYGSSLDVIGPMAKTVADTALVLDVISGHDPRDSTSLPGSPTGIQPKLEGLEADRSVQSIQAVQGMRLGVVKELMGEGLDDATRAAVTAAIERLRSLGAKVQEVSLPSLGFSIATYYVLATAEASANLARYDGVKYGFRAEGTGLSLGDMYRKTRSAGFGREVKQRIMLGTFVLSSGYYDAFYAKANRARQRLTEEVARAFEQVDLLVSPAAPTTAFRLGEKVQDPLAMYLSDICTLIANLAGIPALSLPCERTPAGKLPVGLQLMAPHRAEERLLKGAYGYEQSKL
jgi:aspartyl-tRNA(Asn)/glutamyl-tRNA(Gln) amidotransferase subunit A